MSESKQIPAWLKSIEENSWQIELLISGGLIYTLFNLPEQINGYLVEVVTNSNFSTTHVILFMVAFISSKALLIGFGVNLLLRAIWLAMIGIHFAYPDGIQYDKLNYSSEFTRITEGETSTKNKILWLEKWSSLTYSIAIMLSLIAVGAILIVSAIYHFLLRDFISQDAFNAELPAYGIFIIVLFISFGGLDGIVFRLMRGKSLGASIYHRISKVLSIFNLSIFFKREWLTLISNNKRWRVYLLIALYYSIAVFSTYQDLDEDYVDLGEKFELFDERNYREIPAYRYQMDNNEYDEHLDRDDHIYSASIPAEVIDENLLPVFVSYDKLYDRILGHYFDSLGIYSNWAELPVKDRGLYLESNTHSLNDILNRVLVVNVNLSKQDSIDWMYRVHPITQQEGWATKLDIADLPRGKHSLNIRRQDIGTKAKGVFTVSWIPFWKN